MHKVSNDVNCVATIESVYHAETGLKWHSCSYCPRKYWQSPLAMLLLTCPYPMLWHPMLWPCEIRNIAIVSQIMYRNVSYIGQSVPWPPQLVAWYQIAKFMGPTWVPPGSCRTQMGPMLAPWTLPSGDTSGLFTSVLITGKMWATYCTKQTFVHDSWFLVFCCGFIPINLPIPIRITLVAFGQSYDCPSASEASLSEGRIKTTGYLVQAIWIEAFMFLTKNIETDKLSSWMVISYQCYLPAFEIKCLEAMQYSFYFW